MLDLTLPVIIPVALVVAIGLVLVVVFGSMPGVTRTVARAVWCPLRDRYFAADMEEEVWDGKRVDVARCDAFATPTAITCDKACLRLTKRPRSRMAPVWR